MDDNQIFFGERIGRERIRVIWETIYNNIETQDYDVN
jgi:hypothetical protein